MTEAIITIRDYYLKNRNLFLILLKLLIAAGLLLFILSYVNIEKTFTLLTGADRYYLTIAILLGFANIYLQYLKWMLVCNLVLSERNRAKIVSSLFYGFTAGSVTPARVGEYFGRAIPFKGKPLVHVTAAVLIDKLFSFFMVTIFGSAAFLLFINSDLLYIISLLVIVSSLAYFVYDGKAVIKFIKRLTIKWKWSRAALGSLSLLNNMNNRSRIRLTSLSLLFYWCFILQFALLVTAFSHHYDFVNYIWTGNLVMFAKTIVPSFSFGELGIREGASVYFLEQFGENAAAGLNASIFLFLINIVFPALIGLFHFLKRK